MISKNLTYFDIEMELKLEKLHFAHTLQQKNDRNWPVTMRLITDLCLCHFPGGSGAHEIFVNYAWTPSYQFLVGIFQTDNHGTVSMWGESMVETLF